MVQGCKCKRGRERERESGREGEGGETNLKSSQRKKQTTFKKRTLRLIADFDRNNANQNTVNIFNTKINADI